MKFIFVQVFTAIYLLKATSGIDFAHYHHIQKEEEDKKPIIPILKYTAERDEKGWKYSYESGNGIQAEETGFIKNLGDEKHESVVQHGSVTYHDEHGHPITLTYVADEHGFRAEGEHLPTAPPIPEEIQKSLEEIQREELEHPVQESTEETEDTAGYGQESQLHGQAQAYADPPSYIPKQYVPAQSQKQSQAHLDAQSSVYTKPYVQSTYIQPKYKYPHSQGINSNRRQRH